MALQDLVQSPIWFATILLLILGLGVQRAFQLWRPRSKRHDTDEGVAVGGHDYVTRAELDQALDRISAESKLYLEQTLQAALEDVRQAAKSDAADLISAKLISYTLEQLRDEQRGRGRRRE